MIYVQCNAVSIVLIPLGKYYGDMSIEELKQEALAVIRDAKSIAQLRDVEVKYLGRSGKLTEVLRGLKDVPADERKERGKEANALRELLELEIKTCRGQLQHAEHEQKLATEKIDITQPGRKYHAGSLHPLTIVQREI